MADPALEIFSIEWICGVEYTCNGTNGNASLPLKPRVSPRWSMLCRIDSVRQRIRDETRDALKRLRGGDLASIADRLALLDGDRRALVGLRANGFEAIVLEADPGVPEAIACFDIVAGAHLPHRETLGGGAGARQWIADHRDEPDWVAPAFRP